MNKEQFWSIVDDVHNTTEPRNQTKVRAALENRLRMLPSKEIMEWHQIFEFYWTAAYRNDLWAAATAMGAHCTDDGFMDFRSWLISQGRDVYLAAMQDPDSLAAVDTAGQNLNFEAYPYTAVNAYTQRWAYENTPLPKIIGKYIEWAAKNEQQVQKCLQQTAAFGNNAKEDVAKLFIRSCLWREYDLYSAEEEHGLSADLLNSLSADIPARPDLSADWRKQCIEDIMPKLCAKYEENRQRLAEQVDDFGIDTPQWKLKDEWLKHFLGTLPCTSQEELQVFTQRIAGLTVDDEAPLMAMILRCEPDTAEYTMELLDELQEYKVLKGVSNYAALGRYLLEQDTTIPEELYEYMDLDALGCRYENEHPGVFIGNDYVQYPPAQTQTFGMELQ